MKKLLITYAGNTKEVRELEQEIYNELSVVDHLYVKLGQPGLMYFEDNAFKGPVDFIKKFKGENVTFFANMVPLQEVDQYFYVNDMFFEGHDLYIKNQKCKTILDLCQTHYQKKSDLRFDLLLGEWNDVKDSIHQMTQSHPVNDTTFLTYYGKDVSKGSWSDHVMRPVQHTAETFIQGSQIRCSDLIDPVIYNQTFYTAMVETVIHPTFAMFSEKEAKPIVAGRPFVIFGSPGHLEAFRRLGFKSFAPVINEDYDNEPDMQKRFKLVLDSMHELAQQDPIEVYEKLKNILSHNKWHFENNQWNKEFKIAREECQ